MSEKIQIDAASLLQTIDRLEKYIESLKEIIGQLSERLLEVKAAIDGIKRVQEGGFGELMVSIDKHGNSLIRIKGEVEGKAIVHLGLGVYAENGFADAIKILEGREELIRSEIDRVSRELEQRTKEYERLQGLVYSLAAQK